MAKIESMAITHGKGVHLLFDNGVNLSIQIGGGNYSDNYDVPIGEITYDDPLPPSTRAEIAVWDADKQWAEFFEDDYTSEVKGYVPVYQVFGLIPVLSALEGNPKVAEITEAMKPYWDDLVKRGNTP